MESLLLRDSPRLSTDSLCPSGGTTRLLWFTGGGGGGVKAPDPLMLLTGLQPLVIWPLPVMLLTDICLLAG